MRLHTSKWITAETTNGRSRDVRNSHGARCKMCTGEKLAMFGRDTACIVVISCLVCLKCDQRHKDVDVIYVSKKLVEFRATRMTTPKTK